MMKQIRLIWYAIILVAILVFGLSMSAEYINLRFTGIKTQGQVVGYEKKAVHSGRKARRTTTYDYKVKVEYSKPGSEERTTGMNIIWASTAKYDSGDLVTIYYDRNSPGKILIPGFHSLYPILKNVLIPVLVLAGFAALNLIIRRKKEKEAYLVD